MDPKCALGVEFMLPSKYSKEWEYCDSDWYSWINETISLSWVYFWSITVKADGYRGSQTSFLCYFLLIGIKYFTFLTEADCNI